MLVHNLHISLQQEIGFVVISSNKTMFEPISPDLIPIKYLHDNEWVSRVKKRVNTPRQRRLFEVFKTSIKLPFLLA
jgi:hypothetical protein